jgi:predicted benzoate:H+ symporter BenE
MVALLAGLGVVLLAAIGVFAPAATALARALPESFIVVLGGLALCRCWVMHPPAPSGAARHLLEPSWLYR